MAVGLKALVEGGTIHATVFENSQDSSSDQQMDREQKLILMNLSMVYVKFGTLLGIECGTNI